MVLAFSPQWPFALKPTNIAGEELGLTGNYYRKLNRILLYGTVHYPAVPGFPEVTVKCIIISA